MRARAATAALAFAIASAQAQDAQIRHARQRFERRIVDPDRAEEIQLFEPRQPGDVLQAFLGDHGAVES